MMRSFSKKNRLFRMQVFFRDLRDCTSLVVCLVKRKDTMNGLNGHSNGDMNGAGDIITQNQQRGWWTIGLINSRYRYLTAETFGFKINANGTSLKKKQIWTLEPASGNANDSMIFLRSHLDKYLAVDSFGNVTCEAEEKEPGSKFQISVSDDGTGRWALRNVERGYFLGSSSDKLTCTAKVPGDAELWHVHLAARPQLLDACSGECLFSAEYHAGALALRDGAGAYLAPIGSKAVLKTRSTAVTRDELFSLEDSLPQAAFIAALNEKYVSVKQGVDVTANQDEISSHETFQLEFDWGTKRWYIRTMQDRYWTLETGGGIQASGDNKSSNALFELDWQGDGAVAFRANNGKYLMTKRSGHLYANADAIDDNCKYYFYLINRPILVLKCDQGFVGPKGVRLELQPLTRSWLERVRKTAAARRTSPHVPAGQNGKYWHADSEAVTCDSDSPQPFHLELREPTRLAIRAAAPPLYLAAAKNGNFRLASPDLAAATHWEY
ncbi:jg21255 [Pararge aegeria aegeria]|uniref:Fascin n=1 Tax=Pararge aegeria aegeria TaxID=348720 RepID=A0A8S4RHA4_9NEOP|nr:jg21255 [Pararge aegeria aegeria]